MGATGPRPPGPPWICYWNHPRIMRIGENHSRIMRIPQIHSRIIKNHTKTIRSYFFNGPQPNDTHAYKIIVFILILMVLIGIDHIDVLADSNNACECVHYCNAGKYLAIVSVYKYKLRVCMVKLVSLLLCCVHTWVKGLPMGSYL